MIKKIIKEVKLLPRQEQTITLEVGRYSFEIIAVSEFHKERVLNNYRGKLVDGYLVYVLKNNNDSPVSIRIRKDIL